MQDRTTQGCFFSVILTTYNRPILLKRALESLASQTYKNFEVIVANDFGEPVEHLLREFNLDITYVCPGQNRGVSAARNIALSLCRGSHVAFLDDDDILLPSHLAIHAQSHGAHPGSVIYTDTSYMIKLPDGRVESVPSKSAETFSKESLFVQNFITINNWTHPLDMLKSSGNFDESLPALVDWELLLRLATHFPFVHVPERTSEVWIQGAPEERISTRQRKHFPSLFRKIYARHDDLGDTWVQSERKQLLKRLDDEAFHALDGYQRMRSTIKVNDQTSAFQERLDTLKASFRSIVVVVDQANDPAAVQRTLESLGKQYLQPTLIHVASGDDIASLNDVLLNADVDWIVSITAGDELAEPMLLLIAERASHDKHMKFGYVDEDSIANGTHGDPVFKPDINLDLLRSYPYVGSGFAIEHAAFAELDGFAAAPTALAHVDLLFRVIERYGLPAVGHIAEVLHHAALPFAQWLASSAVIAESAQVVSAHLDRLGVAHDVLPGPVAGINRVQYTHARQPPVSIIIPTRDQLPMLNGLLDSLLAKTSYRNYELLIVDNDSQDPAACAYLDGIERLNNPQLRVLRWPHPFNYSAINNFAAAQARGEYLILLNNDTAVLQEDWIEALLNHAQRPEVGIVGAKLHYPDGRIQHAGVVLGLRGPADHAFIGEAVDAPGYMQRLQVDQNYTAVTAACLMIRKSLYDDVGGLDEQDFKVSYNDVDLCLKAHKAGYLTVWTPYARLMHEGSVSQNTVDKTAMDAKIERFEGEQRAMYRKWLPQLACDPAYNRNLNLDGQGYDLDHTRHHAWQPFDQPLLPRLFCVAADTDGCGHYRVRQPFLAMQRAGLAEGMIALTHLTPVPMERFAPSAMVLQRQITEGQLKALRSYDQFSNAFKVFELDDYLPNLPLKSAHYHQMPKDMLKSIRQAVSLTDRFVVSSAALAEQFAGMHSDIRVVPNRLPGRWWNNLTSKRRKSAKPRVGWAGGAGHRGDLELIADVVRDLAGEVEWVFLGMCPEKLRPYVHEFHEGIAIEQYPAKLAALDLDLALAPLEDNVFNACKSNLRLIEYGACGFPVVCSDIVSYRGDLPVTRVRNRYKDWMDAIRMHLADLDATARMGDALRDEVKRNWMLEGEHLISWRNAWLPD